MGIRTGNDRRTFFIFTTIMAMIAGLFISRALLSFSMLLFLAATLFHKNIRFQLCNFFKTPLLPGMAVLFLLPFVSGLWSTDLHEWSRLMRIKLPLLFLPVAFAGSWQLRARQWHIIALTFIAIIAIGTVWSFQKYWVERDAVAESYLRAKALLTPLGNDHVRFSWLVTIATLLCFFFVENSSRLLQWLSGVLILWFICYLHVLAARTGLFSLYFILGLYGLLKMFQRTKTIVIVALFGAVALPLLAWVALPTFQNRIKYFVYDFSFIRSGTYLPGGNDGNRALSFRAGWHLLKTHPFGTGAGDVFRETNSWYVQHVPGMLETDKLYPSSEWLLYGGSTGWPGVLLFTIIMALPFLYKPPANSFYWQALCGTAALSFLFDIGLEVQYGVFTYSFLLLWWWKWFSFKKAAV